MSGCWLWIIFVRFGSIGVFTEYGCRAGIPECVFMVIGADEMTVGITLLLNSNPEEVAMNNWCCC